MICRLTDITDARLNSLVEKYGQAEGLRKYLRGEDITTEEPSQVDELIAGSESKFEPKEYLAVKAERARLQQLKDSLRNSTDPDQIKALNKLIQASESKYERLRNQLEDFQENYSLTKIFEQAEDNFAELDRIFSKPNLSYEDLQYAKNITNFWIKAGEFIPGREHMFLDKDEADDPAIKAKFIEFRNRADEYNGRDLVIKEDKITEDVNAYNGTNKSKEAILGIFKDAWGLQAEAMSLGRVDNDMLQAIYKAVEEVNSKSEILATQVWKRIDEAYEKALPGLRSIQRKTGGSTVFDVFKQQREDGKLTGNITFRFSQEFYDQKRELFRKASRLDRKYRNNPDAILKAASSKAWKEYYNFLNNEMTIFDVRMLFADEQADDGTVPDQFIYSRKTYAPGVIAQHEAMLKEQLGEKGFQIYMESQEKKIEKFKAVRQAAWDVISGDPSLTDAQKNQQMLDWVKENSPYWALDMKESPAMRIKPDNSYYSPSYKYTVDIPLRVYPNGKKSKWYDKKFELIEADDKVLEFYNLMIDLIDDNKAMIGDKADMLQMNSIPFIKNTIIDLFADKGMSVGVAGIWDKFVQGLRTDDLSSQATGKRDVLTGERGREVNLGLSLDQRGEIQSIVDLKVAKYKVDNGKNPTAAIVNEFKKEAMDEVAKEKSFDLVKVMKAFSLASIAYKNKIAIQPFIETASEVFSNLKKAETNAAGEVYIDKDGNPVGSESLKNMKAMLDFYLDEKFWATGGKAIEGKTKKKVYTREESKKLKELNSLATSLEEKINSTDDEELKKSYQKDLDKVKAQIEELGGTYTLSKIGDNFLQWVQLKGMGWNVTGALSNMGFGSIANWTEASDRRLIDQKSLRKAYVMMLNSVAKNLTFNGYANPTATKIRGIMDNLNILQQSAEELYKRTTESTFTKKAKRFGAYNVNARAEYLNQGALVLAYLLKNKATNIATGEDVSLYEAFDENGELKEGFSFRGKKGIEGQTELKLVLGRVVSKVHGDYKDPLKGKKTFLGRALFQFRTWMPEGFASRFEAEKEDYILGITRKGRYRSGFLFVSYSDGSGMGALKQTLFTLKQLGRKMLFLKTQFDEAGFSEVDAANLRKNLTELVFLIGAVSLTLALKALREGDDEEDDLTSMGINILINQGNRLQNDILTYMDPREGEKLIKSALPVLQVLNDVRIWSDAVERQFSDNPNVQTGPMEGMNWLLRRTIEITPGVSSGFRLYKQSSYILGER